MENSDQQSTAESTPMKKVWKVVILTMLGTTLLAYAWHGMEMLRVKASHTREANALRENITKLSEYRDSLRAKQSTSTMTTNNTEAPLSL
jgi:hypothetical protein